MKTSMTTYIRRLCLVLAAGLLCCTGAAFAADVLDWNTNKNTVTADISGGSLVSLLERVAGATGWQVFLEPNTTHKVSAKFTKLLPGQALQLLLGDVNFALIPDEKGSRRLFVFRTDQKNATQRVKAVRSTALYDAKSKLITNELIVRLKPGAKIEDLARQLGARVIGRIDGLNAYRLQFDDGAAANTAREQLASNSDVESVDSKYAIDRPQTPVAVNGGASTPQLRLKPPPDSGRIIVGLVDTAVQPLGNNLDSFLLKQISVAGDAQLDSSSPTHGTAMAETLLHSLESATKGTTSVQILPVDVYGSSEMTSTFDVAKGIVQAINGGAQIINLSLGSTGESATLHDLIRQAAQQNIAIFAAKGNDPTTAPFYPAAYPEVTAVTAFDRTGQVAPYANRAPIFSVGASGLSFVPFNSLTFGVQGTSVSTALVSGQAAGYMDANGKTATEARSYIISTMGVK